MVMGQASQIFEELRMHQPFSLLCLRERGDAE